MNSNRLGEALQLARRALAIEEQLREDFPDVPGYLSAVASVQYTLGQIYLLQNCTAESAQAFRTAIETEVQVVRLFPNLNRESSLVSFYALCPMESLRDPARAVVLARQALERNPDHPAIRSLLGAALYRACDWNGTIKVLADEPLDTQGSGYFLAMAHWQLGDREMARGIYRETSRLHRHGQQPNTMLRLLQEEVASLIEPLESRE